MSALPDHAHTIGGHPMAGTEVPGAAGARPEALTDAPFVLTPVRNDPVALARGRTFAEAVGSRPVVVSAADHDRVVARTSHLPHLMAFALVAAARRAGDPASIAELSGSGFRGATRLAASDPAMVAAFLSANRTEVKAAVAEFRASLTDLERALDLGTAELASILMEAAGNAYGEVER
jgi:prephenate dehydrogenase